MGDNELRMQELLLKGSNILQSLLTCSICGNLLNDPRILTCCSQSACFICISQTFYQNQQEQSLFLKPQNKNGSTCPICNKELKKRSLLPKNHFLENILQILELQININNNNNDYNDQNSVDCKNKRDNDNNKDKVIYCNSWDSREATTYCAECDSYLCSECWNIIHSICKYQTHTALSPHALKPTSRIADSSKLICYQHPNYFNDLYCQSCDTAICPLCLVDNHSDISKHKVTSVSKYADQIKSKLLQRCDLILTDSSKLNDDLSALSNRISSYQLQISDLQNKIADLQSRIESKNQKKSNLQHKLNEIKSIHQIIITAIDFTFSSDSDFINQEIINRCNVDIHKFYEKLYSLKLPLSLNLFDPPPPPPVSKRIWSLNRKSLKCDSALSYLLSSTSYQLISNKHFVKLKAGYCSITCKESVKMNTTSQFTNYQWQIMYLPLDIKPISQKIVIDTDIDLSHKKRGLEVTVIEAVNLPPMNKSGSTNAYVRLLFSAESISTIFKTDHVSNNFDPKWNKHFVLKGEFPKLIFEVFHFDDIDNSTMMIGYVALNLRTLKYEEEVDVWEDIRRGKEGPGGGRLHFKVILRNDITRSTLKLPDPNLIELNKKEITNTNPSNQITSSVYQSTEDIDLTIRRKPLKKLPDIDIDIDFNNNNRKPNRIGVEIIVIEAANLPTMNKKAVSAYVRVLYGPDISVKTKHVSKNQNPIWQKQFILAGEFPKIIFEVVDHDLFSSDKLIGIVAFNMQLIQFDHEIEIWEDIIKTKESAGGGRLHFKVTMRSEVSRIQKIPDSQVDLIELNKKQSATIIEKYDFSMSKKLPILSHSHKIHDIDIDIDSKSPSNQISYLGIEVIVIEATILPAMNRSGSTDAYVRVQYGPDNSVKTIFIRNTLNPKWQKQFILSGNYPKITFEVFNYDEENRQSSMIGYVSFPLSTLKYEENIEIWEDIKKGKEGPGGGRLHFKVALRENITRIQDLLEIDNNSDNINNNNNNNGDDDVEVSRKQIEIDNNKFNTKITDYDVDVVDNEGWLLIGLHSNPSSFENCSFSEYQCMGWNITRKSSTNNGSFLNGKFTSIGRLQAESGDILKFSFNTKLKTIRLEHPSWHVETTLQSDFEHYYLHFNSRSASFKLLSCSLLLDTN